MDKRFAVMDLGTNTFHLLIAEGSIEDFKEIVHKHIAVKLGEGGINKGIILPAAFGRGMDTMKDFKRQINEHNVQKISAIATSALRNASNGKDFVDEVKKETGIEIEVVDGEREATFIYEGVRASGLLSDDHSSLVMDIGGGSVEFIVCNNRKLIWKQSFEIGAARLLEKFHHNDPIPPAAIEALYHYLEDELTSLFEAVKSFKINNLIGSSGAFETFAELAAFKRNEEFDLKKIKSYEFDYDELFAITGGLILSSHAEREANLLIVPVRVDMIVVASLITRYVVQKLDINHVALCTYSLKEGVLARMMS
ncbi:Ppx/GppA phosphatase family protein [Mucilaginibacter ginsenosidivorans]|uniref:Exopolyphosphatase n=1 Tax=Mucilaginibacter ginsenosidivorans TaxID=398053 RepID=A0A5B8UYJ4_9SPHI|nr:exopolyphosphatase [Mucilaginibacter ginsenosidivorans]QEC63998.1 exopolyphosphatase [Mucilaginibacter ginsenosidivorans]